MTTKKPAPAGSDRRFAQAVDAFEKAVKALGKRDFAKARDLLDQLIEAHPDERDVLDRARTYRDLCRTALEKKPTLRPKGFEELLTHGVYLHNRGEHEDALKFLHQAADERPDSEDAFYCVAASAAQVGDAPAAIEALTRAIALGSGSRVQARADSDFDALRDNEEFIDLVYAQA